MSIYFYKLLRGILAKIALSSCSFILFVFFANYDLAVSAAKKSEYSIALIVESDNKDLSENITSFKSAISGTLSKQGVKIINPDFFVSPSSEKLGKHKISTLRLSQSLNADFFIAVNIGTYFVESKSFQNKELGVSVDTNVHSLLVSYNLQQTSNGITVKGDAFQVSKTITNTSSLAQSQSSLIRMLAVDAANRIGSKVVTSIENITVGEQNESLIALEVRASADNRFGAYSRLPSFLSPAGDSFIFESELAADIIIDGFLVGTTPGSINVFPGVHDISIERKGYEAYSKKINITNKTTVKAVLGLTEKERKIWENDTKFLYDLDRDKKLTEAEITNIIQKAKALEQKGYVFDVKVDTKDGIKLRDNNLLRSIKNTLKK